MLKTFSPPEKVIRSGSLYEAAVKKIDDNIEKKKHHGSIIMASQLLDMKSKSEYSNTKIGFKKDPMQQQSLKSYFTKVDDPNKEEKLVESSHSCSEKLNADVISSSPESNSSVFRNKKNVTEKEEGKLADVDLFGSDSVSEQTSKKNKLTDFDLFGSDAADEETNHSESTYNRKSHFGAHSVGEQICRKRKTTDCDLFGSDAADEETSNSESTSDRKSPSVEEYAPDIRAKRRRVSHLTPKPAPSITVEYLERISKCFGSSDAEDSTDDYVPANSFQTNRRNNTKENEDKLKSSLENENFEVDSTPMSKTVEFVSRLSGSYTKRIETLFDDAENEDDFLIFENAEKSSRHSSPNNSVQKAVNSRSKYKCKEYDPTEVCSREKRKHLGMSRSYRSGISSSNAVNSSNSTNSSSVSKSEDKTKQMFDNSFQIANEKKTKEAKFAVSEYVKKFLMPHYQKKKIINKELFKFTARNIVHKAVQKLDVACKYKVNLIIIHKN